MRLAAAAYTPEWHPTWEAFCTKLDRWVEEAVDQGADLLVFPEYAGLEAALIGTQQDQTTLQWVEAGAGCEAAYIAELRALTKAHGVYVLSGSGPAMTAAGFVNRAWLIGPDEADFQEKMIPTPYERAEMGLSAGTDLKLFGTGFGKIGVLICYDSEFPLLARTMVEAGAEVLLVPSCTDFTAGQTRVRQSCRARAIEQQCLVVQAPLVGAVPDCRVIDVNTGRAAGFCPPDFGLPATGILAQGKTDVAGWTLIDVDMESITGAREKGQVGNFVHWDEQISPQREVTFTKLS